MAGRELRKVRLKRGHPKAFSSYLTPDGRWEVWREPYPPRRWYVNDTRCDETEVADGFETKREAVKYLAGRLGNG